MNLNFISALAATFSLFFLQSAYAIYPEKPVKIIVPFAPGGATDLVGRALALKLSGVWNQQVLVENKPGAGGNIGADSVAKSSPDGYTFLLASPAEVAINPSLYKFA